MTWETALRGLRIHAPRPSPADLNELRAEAYKDPARPHFKRYLKAVEPFQLRLNIAAASSCREQMAAFEMLAGGRHQPLPRWPSWDSTLFLSESEHRSANPAVWTVYEEAERQASCQRGSGPGIARFKLESNGPWIVVAEEVEGALLAYDAVGSHERFRAESDELWSMWIGCSEKQEAASKLLRATAQVRVLRMEALTQLPDGLTGGRFAVAIRSGFTHLGAD